MYVSTVGKENKRKRNKQLFGCRVSNRTIFVLLSIQYDLIPIYFQFHGREEKRREYNARAKCEWCGVCGLEESKREPFP